jgi:voltage-gated potassium channel
VTGLLIALLRRTGRILTRQWLAPLIFFVSIFVYSTTGYMYFEVAAKPDLTWTDAAWWSVVTMTTVGYGDYFPESTAGRMLVGVPTMLLGVSILGYLLSLLATAIMESRLKEIQGMTQMRFSDHIVVCRYNGLGATLKLLGELRSDPSTREAKVVLIDEQLEEIPAELRARDVSFVRGDPSRQAVLEQANFGEARVVLIQCDAADLPHSDEKNLAVALTVERLRPGVFTVVHCVDPERAVFFERAGCDSVVCPESLSSQLVVQELQDPGVHAVVAELTSNAEGKQFYIVPPPAAAGTAGDLASACARIGAVFVGLRRGGGNLLMPEPGTPLKKGDLAVIIARQRPGSL